MLVEHKNCNKMKCPACESGAQRPFRNMLEQNSIVRLYWRCWACRLEYETQITVKPVKGIAS